MAKAIETAYKGYRFRSRLEARWAVFFDSLGIEWDYEPQGYVLSTGDCYLPDFWLTQVDMWAEVKPAKLPLEDFLKLKTLVEDDASGAVLLEGMPEFRLFRCIYHDGFEVCESECLLTTDYFPHFWCTAFPDEGDDDLRRRFCQCTESTYPEGYAAAVYAARGSRFEFGESGSAPAHDAAEQDELKTLISGLREQCGGEPFDREFQVRLVLSLFEYPGFSAAVNNALQFHGGR